MKFFTVSLRWFPILFSSWSFWIRQRGGIRAVDACSSACYNFSSISRARRGPEGFSKIVKLSTDPTEVRARMRECMRVYVRAYARLCGVVERGRVGLKRVRRESTLSSSILTRGSQWLLVSAPRQQRGEKTIQTLAFFTSRSSTFRYGRLTALVPRFWK